MDSWQSRMPSGAVCTRQGSIESATGLPLGVPLKKASVRYDKDFTHFFAQDDTLFSLKKHYLIFISSFINLVEHYAILPL